MFVEFGSNIIKLSRNKEKKRKMAKEDWKVTAILKTEAA